eukprot:SAG25_NODE_1709_length_2500_cov_2.232403_3_plen_101_part_00
MHNSSSRCIITETPRGRRRAGCCYQEESHLAFVLRVLASRSTWAEAGGWRLEAGGWPAGRIHSAAGATSPGPPVVARAAALLAPAAAGGRARRPCRHRMH